MICPNTFGIAFFLEKDKIRRGKLQYLPESLSINNKQYFLKIFHSSRNIEAIERLRKVISMTIKNEWLDKDLFLKFSPHFIKKIEDFWTWRN